VKTCDLTNGATVKCEYKYSNSVGGNLHRRRRHLGCMGSDQALMMALLMQAGHHLPSSFYDGEDDFYCGDSD
jgi:hypothetical protein